MFKGDSITDEIEETVNDDDLELNKEMMGVSLGFHGSFFRSVSLSLYIYIYIYLYFYVDMCVYMYMQSMYLYTHATLQPRCLTIFEQTGHIWYTAALQQCFAKFYGESWLTRRVAVVCMCDQK